MVTLSFQLNVNDGWPPVSAEGIPCSAVSAWYRIESPPLFVKQLSVGDVISASPDKEGRVWEWTHVEKSKHTTVWIGRQKQSAQIDIEILLQKLRAIECTTIGSESLGCYAIDIPPQCRIEDVDELIGALDSEEIAVAFPSFRHRGG